MKVCPRCNESKPPEAYQYNASAPDGLQSHCRPCRNAYRSELRKRKPEQARARDRRGNLKRYGLREQLLPSCCH
jgi:hypothetical protein